MLHPLCPPPPYPDRRVDGIESRSPHPNKLLTFVGHLTSSLLLSMGMVPLAQWIGTAGGASGRPLLVAIG